ncbi:MAG: rhomboid family intramembrane serine protease [Thermoleophilia bacterium]|nr:rhomboid family intramembrane serine protease [Actinomycetota bacterium]
MIPLRDNIPTLRFAYVTYLFIGVNILVFLYELALGQRGFEEFVLTYGYVPRNVAWAITSGDFSAAALFPLVTSIFIHGGWVHLLGNMLYLHIFGNNVEDSMGHLRFAFFYVGIGALANLGQVLVTPGSDVPGIGASGAIAGVLGAYLLLYPRAGVLVLVPFFFFVPMVIPAVVVLVFWFVIQLFQGTLTLAAGAAGAGGVAFWVHATGFVLGMVLIPLFRNRRLTEVKAAWR